MAACYRSVQEREIEYREIAAVCHLIFDQPCSLDYESDTNYMSLLEIMKKLHADINAICINLKTFKKQNPLPQSIQFPKSIELGEYIKKNTSKENALNTYALVKLPNNKDRPGGCLIKELALQLTCVVGEVLEFAEMLQRDKGPISTRVVSC